MNSFVINWVGPFFDINELTVWEKENEQDEIYNFYIVTGKLKGKKTITKYCGITDNQNGYIYSRFYDKKHKVHELLRETNIWIGYISDNNNIIDRADLELCETMIISYWQPEENIKKKAYYPSESVSLVNRWFDLNNNLRTNMIYPAQKLSDVIVYAPMQKCIFGADRLKTLVSIEY